MDHKQISEEEWKKKLTKEQYHVLREGGTEKPFTDPYFKKNEQGIYECAACSNPLFASNTKFESGTGWPSFTAPLHPNSIEYHEDYKLGYKRIEVCCAQCHSHLGHVFDDGPLPTGKRYCLNSICLSFNKGDKNV